MTRDSPNRLTPKPKKDTHRYTTTRDLTSPETGKGDHRTNARVS